MTEELTLYDEEALAAKEVNGSEPTPVPPPIEYLETENEEELRAVISQLNDVLEALIPVPEWVVKGKIVRVLIRGLNAKEWAQFQEAHIVNGRLDLVKVYPDLVILTVRHPVTKRLVFKRADREMLLEKMGRAVERMAMKASDLSGISQRAQDILSKN